MNKLVLFFTLLFFSVHLESAQSALSQVDPVKLKAMVPTTVDKSKIDAYKAAHLLQIDYFFDHLPQAPLPDSLVAEIEKLYSPLLTIVSPIDSNQTQPERQTQVMNHIKRFYGLLYLIAQAELYNPQESATVGSGKKTTLATNDVMNNASNNSTRVLTPEQLIQSQIWQDHLKIMVASSFMEEYQLLNKVHEHELTMFKYLPVFETAYYQPAVTHIRKSSELTRMYLLLVDRMRKRFLQKINPGSNWGKLVSKITQLEQSSKIATPKDKISYYQELKQTKNNLYQEISDFQQSPFYNIVMEFQNIDWSKSTLVKFEDPQGNPISLLQAVKNKYDFGRYFSFDVDQKTVTVAPHLSLCLEVENNSAGGQDLYLTGLGNYFFTGTATTRTVTTADNHQVVLGTLEVVKKTNPNQLTLDQFFVEVPTTETVNGVKVTHTVTETTLGFYELLCFMAMKSLQSDVADLFKEENLSLTFSKMANPFTLPNFMEKWPEDYPILHDIATIQKFFVSQGVAQSTDTVKPQSFLSSIGSAFSDIADAVTSAAEGFYDTLPGPVQRALKGIKDAIKTGFTEAAEKSWDAIKDVGDAAWHAVKVVGYESVSLYYASCILPLVTYGLSGGTAGTANFNTALKDSQGWQAAATQQIDETANDLGQAVAEVAAAVESVETVASGIVASVVGMVDSKLGEDLAGVMNAVTSIVVNYFKDYADAVILIGDNIVKLTAESVQMISSILGSTVLAMKGKETGFDLVGDDIKTIAETTAASVLNLVTFLVNALGEELKSVMITIAYLTAAATQLVIDIDSITAAVVVAAFTGEWNYNQYHEALESHSRLISGIIMLVAVIAITVVTGGAAAPFAVAMLALTAPMMVMSIIGDAQQDAMAIHKKAHEKQFTQDYKEYVISSASVVEGFNTLTIIEQLVQLQAESINHERALLYSQNYLNDLFSSSLSQSAYAYGSGIFKNLAINQTTGVVQADLGSLYGITTGRFNITPTGNGFPIYNDARQTFTQEAVQEPLVLQKPSSILSQTQAIETFWFRQKDLSVVANNMPLQADVLWKSLYENDESFYIGVYLTERYFDPIAINNAYNNFIGLMNPKSGNTSSADFDAAWLKLDAVNRYLTDYDHHAKMFVCSPNVIGNPTTGTTAQLGVYVHEAPEVPNSVNGWLQNNFSAINFKRGVWYRMQAVVNGSTLTTVFWEVGTDQDAKNASPADTPPANAQVQKFNNIPVAQVPPIVAGLDTQNSYAGSMGVIASGASIEYVVLSPQPSITISQQRTQSNSTVNQQSVTAQNQNWYQNLAGQMNPTFGNFSFTPVSDSAILQGQYIYTTQGTFNSSETDYVVFVSSLTPTGNQVGVTPTINPAPVGIMSLATGEIYNSSGQMVGQVANPVFLYQQANGQIPQSVVNQLPAVRKEYWQSMTGPFNFSGTTLNGLLPAMTQGVFVYSVTPQQNGYTDYLIGALTGSVGISTTNIPLIMSSIPNTLNTFISLVSGNVYTIQAGSAQNSYQIVSANNNYSVYSQYQNQLPQAVQNQIAASQKIYQAQTANIAADQALQQQGQSAVNTLNSAMSAAQTEINFAQGSYVTAITTAQTAAQSALTTLQTDLANLTTAMTKATVSTTASIYTSLQASIAAANNAAAALNNAVTAANNAPSASTTSYGSSSSSGYGASSSYGNFNSTYGGYSGYGSSYGSSYSGYGSYG